ncbi:TlpA family protein disulfide reductase [Microbacterium luticocti]|uniref:TlpA family protein disulfide reductase n=1 Tax=Microbacterium luticocti TaxID=451764 RepID=UPI00048BA110|nr:thioredoxin family protein [Microbacterium luticocti]
MPVWTAALLAVALVAATALIGFALRRGDGRARAVTGDLTVPVAADVRGSHATLVQFSTELCTRCPQVRRMLQPIADRTHGVAFAEVDLTHRPDVARRLHILQTPTVFVLDAHGLVRTRFAGVPAADAITAELDRLIGEHVHV